DANNGLAVGGLGSTFSNRRALILGTTNGGATWQTRFLTSRSGEWCWKIHFPTTSVGYVSIETFTGQAFFLKTTDGGLTWQDKFFQNSYEEQGIGFATADLGWIGGWSGPAYQTTDGGNTWTSAFFGSDVNRFRMLSSTLGYAVGETVYKYQGTTAVALDPSPAMSFRLAESYPNPFQGTTTIGYVVTGDAEVRLTIHNALGRRVMTLADGHASPGSHALTWDGRDAAGKPVGSGVYWVRLESGGVAESKSLVVAR
ncbi:MAG TPA: FlgD immunoglobulin-like domain containing protein, partial [Candidatus Udaeobacter sp.]|nr:FlgD immunoglobulin-like domain containing protein [Candidatus Udaeobacter sp.]